MPWNILGSIRFTQFIGAAYLDGLHLPLWTWFIGRRLQAGLKWGHVISLLGLGWSVGVFAPTSRVLVLKC